MNVLYIVNIPAPYRVDFFNELGSKCDLTVLYEGESEAHRNSDWIKKNAENYKAVFLKQKKVAGKIICAEVVKYIKMGFDHIVVGAYNTPTCIIAMLYMKMHRIHYWINVDGGIVKNEEVYLKRMVKKVLLSSADYWLSPSKKSDEYLTFYGAKEDRIYRYHFTSLLEDDLNDALEMHLQKEEFKRRLDLKEKVIVLTVGRFNLQGGYGKGFDTIMETAEACKNQDIGFLILGDEPTEEFLHWKKQSNLSHVHFVGFQKKETIKQYYAAADIFMLLTRGDVWGLVINEAMAFSLPIITTYQCVAGLELIEDGINGFLLSSGDSRLVTLKMKELLGETKAKLFGTNSYDKIRDYTIEQMAQDHIHIFGEIDAKNSNSKKR